MSRDIPSDPTFFHARPPVLEAELRALGPRCERIQFNETLAESDHRTLAGFLREHPRMGLRIFGGFSDASLLKPYDGIARLQVDMFAGPHPTVLGLLPRSLTSLTIVSPEPPALDLRMLEELGELTELHVFARSRNAAVLTRLTKLRSLSLSRISARDMTVLEQLESLEELRIRGAAFPADALPVALQKLRRLELVNLRKTASVDDVTAFPALERLRLEQMPLLTRLPSLEPLVHLSQVWLESLRNLEELGPIANAPRLEWLACMSMPRLEPAHFEPFRGHRSLRRVYYSSGPFSAALFGRGGHKSQDAVREMLGVDPAIHDAWPSWR